MYTYLNQKRFYRWCFTLLSAIVIFSCDHDEDFYYNDTTIPNISDNQHVITIFRNTFREYASLDIDYSLEGLHPGNFAPVWDEATLYTDTDRLTLTSPIITEATYDGSFICNSNTTITYHTAIAQQMILVYDFNNECFSFYIASIIPNEENATESRLKALKMFDIFTPESSFSGTVVYSNMTTNYTIAVEQYDSGHVTNVRTLFNFSGNIERDIEEMENIIGAKRICRNVRALTRDSEFTFTGMNYIDGVTCTAPQNSPSQTTYTAPTPTYTIPRGDFGPLPPTYPDYANRPHGGIGHSTKNNTSSSAHPSTMPSAPTKTSQKNNSPNKVNVTLELEEGADKALYAQIKPILENILTDLRAMGIEKELKFSLNSIKFRVARYCSANARVVTEKNGTKYIDICSKWLGNDIYQYTYNDQKSIIFHEIWHYLFDTKVVDKDKTVNLPHTMDWGVKDTTDFRYIFQKYYTDFGKMNYPQKEQDIKDRFIFTLVYSPILYQNEINAYNAEMKYFNDNLLSEGYRLERKYILEKYKFLKPLADEYYK